MAFLKLSEIIQGGQSCLVGSNISTSLEMTGLQSWSIDFFLLLCSEMICDNFKKAILLYVYYMGAIETWPTL